MNIEPIELDCEVEMLLASEDLPVSDLRSPNQASFFGVRVGGHIVGVVAIELHGNVGLLRSLVVGMDSRKTGCGRELVAKAEAWASEKGVQSLYLLTTTAASFFSGLGYEVVPRNRAPVSIASSAQFAQLCPASATFMYKTLAVNKAGLNAKVTL